MTPFALILSGVVAMAAAYPPGLLQEMHKQEISEDGMQSEGGDFNDGVITGMALLQEMLQGKLELADSMENARLQEVSYIAGSSKNIAGSCRAQLVCTDQIHIWMITNTSVIYRI